jgi:4'-phosphopantetheinyl transferase
MKQEEICDPQWQPGAESAALSRGGAAVWWLLLDDVPETAWRRWSALIDEREAARAARFYFEADRQQFIAAHALTRRMLAAFGSRRASDWRFVEGRNGKPEIEPPDGTPPLRFNLSHTRGLVACAVSRGRDLGVDIESMSRPGPDLSIADAYFAPSEVALLRAMPEAMQRDTFFRLWTLKESYIKATGDGLSLALDSFSFTFDPIRLWSEAAGELRPGWHFEQFRPSPLHLLAVALNAPKEEAVVVCARAIDALDL